MPREALALHKGRIARHHSDRPIQSLEASDESAQEAGATLAGCVHQAAGVAKQTLTRYEAGRLLLLAGELPTLADQLGVSIEDLMAFIAKRSTGKRSSARRMQQQVERTQ